MPAYPLPGQGRDAGWNDSFFAEWQADLPLHGLQHYVRVYGIYVCVASSLSEYTVCMYFGVCGMCLVCQTWYVSSMHLTTLSEYVRSMWCVCSMSEYVCTVCMYGGAAIYVLRVDL